MGKSAVANEPPFDRGGFNPANSTEFAASAQFGASILGQEWDFDDMLWDTAIAGPPTRRSGFPVTVRLVKNNTGSAILPKKLCKIDPADPGSVIAITTAVTDDSYPADEFLPATGCPNLGVFYVVVRGLAKVIEAATIIGAITAGDFLGPSAVTAGAVDIQDYSLVPTSAGAAKTFNQTQKAARFKATANIGAGASGSATTTVFVNPDS